MYDIVQQFPTQIDEAIKISTDVKFDNVSNIVVAAMGGSAIASEIIGHFSRVPFTIIRDYNVPPILNKKTLFIGISYSGDTEETVSCFKQAKAICQTIAITSGGKLASLSQHPIMIPSGMQPRAAIAYLLFPLARILVTANLLVDIDITEACHVAHSCSKSFTHLACDISKEIRGTPLIYGYGPLASVALRWRQQLNENAKMASFEFALPECNHNEIEVWEREVQQYTCIFLRGKNEASHAQKRFSFMKQIYAQKARVIEVFAEGTNLFSQAVSLIHLGDLVSVEMARLNEIPAEPVALITQLKKELS